MNKKILFFILLILPAFFSCRYMNGSYQEKFSGTLELTEYSLGSKAAGRLDTLTVEEGERVEQGKVIATFDRFDQTKKDYERALNLMKLGGGSEQSVEEAQLAWKDQQIIAPIDGVVLLKIHEVGEVVAPGNPVVTLGDDQKPWVRIYVPEGIINKLRINQEAILSFDGLERTFKGHVMTIAPQAEFTPRNVQTPEERITQTFAVKIALDEPRLGLRPGVAVDVTLRFQEPN